VISKIERKTRELDGRSKARIRLYEEACETPSPIYRASASSLRAGR
jgi:hypothetical protein